MQPDTTGSEQSAPGSAAAMKEYVTLLEEASKTKQPSTLNPHTPLKELYRQMTDADAKYDTL